MILTYGWQDGICPDRYLRSDGAFLREMQATTRMVIPQNTKTPKNV
jgi:hypothetical protein